MKSPQIIAAPQEGSLSAESLCRITRSRVTGLQPVSAGFESEKPWLPAWLVRYSCQHGLETRDTVARDGAQSYRLWT